MHKFTIILTLCLVFTLSNGIFHLIGIIDLDTELRKQIYLTILVWNFSLVALSLALTCIRNQFLATSIMMIMLLVILVASVINIYNFS
jgi:hypothetical protein